MIFRNVALLAYDSFEFIENADVIIDGGKIAAIDEKQGSSDLLLIPAFVDAHTHVGDSFAKDFRLDKSLEGLVGRKGLKHRLLEKIDRKEQLAAIRKTFDDFVKNGILSFCDFREQGIYGVGILHEALKGRRMNAVVLGRAEKNEWKDWKTITAVADGANIPTTTQYLDSELKTIRKIVGKGIFATHVSETAEARARSIEKFKKSDVRRALDCGVDFLVHCNYISEDEVGELRRKKIPVVCCPRANAVMREMNACSLADEGVKVGIGTDNVMLNSPDMFREMEFLFHLSRIIGRELEPVEILKMATKNGADILRLNNGVIKKGKDADLLLIDLSSPNLFGSKDILASLVHRASSRNIKRIFFKGKPLR